MACTIPVGRHTYSHWQLAKAGVWSRANPWANFGGHSGTRKFFSPVLRIFPVCIIQSMLHSYLHLNNTFIRRKSGRTLKTLKKLVLFKISAERLTD
jgi:hypothetical protein